MSFTDALLRKRPKQHGLALSRLHQLLATSRSFLFALALARAPSISKNVYDSVTVGMSPGIAGSIKNTTGICLVSCGLNDCWVKQKHSSLRKYTAAACGA